MIGKTNIIVFQSAWATMLGTMESFSSVSLAKNRPNTTYVMAANPKLKWIKENAMEEAIAENLLELFLLWNTISLNVNSSRTGATIDVVKNETAYPIGILP